MSRYCIVLLALLYGVCLHSQEPVQEQVPGIFEYHPVDLAPQPLNQHLVRKAIGYPPKAIKAGISGKVFCRVLVNEQGAYIRHALTRVDHPELGEAVDPQVHFLKFSPAFIGNKPVTTWTNIIFAFDESSQRYEFDQVYLEPRTIRKFSNLFNRATYFQEEGERALGEKNLSQAMRMHSQVIAIANEKRKKSAWQRWSFFARAARSEVYALQGNLEAAIEDLTEAIGMGQAQLRKVAECQEVLPSLYQDRAELYLLSGNPYEALEDLRWLERSYPCTSPFLHAQMAETFIQLGQWEPARAQLEKISECPGEEAPTHAKVEAYQALLQGMIHLEEEAYEQAFTAWQQSLEVYPENPLAYFYKGLTIHTLGGTTYACEDLKIALDMGLRGTRAHKALALLQQMGCLGSLSAK